MVIGSLRDRETDPREWRRWPPVREDSRSNEGDFAKVPAKQQSPNARWYDTWRRVGPLRDEEPL